MSRRSKPSPYVEARAYDALETAQVLTLCRRNWPSDINAAPEEVFGRLRVFERNLPTQTYRSEGQIEMQQFSTPITLAWLAAVAAAIEPEDRVLEPSAGTGMLAIHAKRAEATLTLNERDTARADLLARTFGQSVSRHDAEHIDDLLPATKQPTVILMNPPFSRSELRGRDRHAGARHLRSDWSVWRRADGASRSCRPRSWRRARAGQAMPASPRSCSRGPRSPSAAALMPSTALRSPFG